MTEKELYRTLFNLIANPQPRVKLKPDQYQCAQRKGIFEKEWSDEEAEQEAQDKFQGMDTSKMSMVCDDCYKELIQANEN